MNRAGVTCLWRAIEQSVTIFTAITPTGKRMNMGGEGVRAAGGRGRHRKEFGVAWRWIASRGKEGITTWRGRGMERKVDIMEERGTRGYGV